MKEKSAYLLLNEISVVLVKRMIAAIRWSNCCWTRALTQRLRQVLASPLSGKYSLYNTISLCKRFCMSFSEIEVLLKMFFFSQLRCYCWRPGECHNDHELCKQVQHTMDNCHAIFSTILPSYICFRKMRMKA